mgnify:CR=1 FL=1
MYVLSGDKNDEFKIKGSLFKAYSFKVNDIISIKDKLSILNDNFLNASHICYAYRICNINNLDLFNNPEIIEFYADDGEPSGTAGKPILNVLKKNKIINNVIFVIRYFGRFAAGFVCYRLCCVKNVRCIPMQGISWQAIHSPLVRIRVDCTFGWNDGLGAELTLSFDNF